jgi:hypothetical protein
MYGSEMVEKVNPSIQYREESLVELSGESWLHLIDYIHS